ncbi:hypothetical protein CUMW_286040 [Citrus unshiu]|uniref:Uncharacterized protein n=1 Tax=Citrus unshiu TaxID=55188 RepID=A0A2H5N3W5_CITUN|nr:hypothetical protein CUMW_286040 [Citrus unshiu]
MSGAHGVGFPICGHFKQQNLAVVQPKPLDPLGWMDPLEFNGWERIAVLKGLENQRIDDFTIAYTTTRYFILINHPYFGYNTEGGI